MSAPLFELQNASLDYGSAPVLRDVTVRIESGEHVALVGPSGSGKSTLLQHLYRQQREHSALCTQACGLVPVLSAYHNVYMGQLHRHSALYNLLNLIRPWRGHRQAIETLLATLGMADKLMVSVDRLSGGQQQRTAIARALYQRQPIFLGDEPTSSLDPLQSDEMLTLIQRQHTTSVVALHDQQLALRRFSRVIGLNAGRIAFDLPAHHIDEQRLHALYRN